MYSGTTLTPISGRLLGAHQKFDRAARRQLSLLLDDHANSIFPPIKTILKFEGTNGPDGIKRKSPAQDEPWHYFNPFDLTDTDLAMIINDHMSELVAALNSGNQTRAAFEAAWLAHAIVDGLTPAHLYPYEVELEKLREGEPLHTRTTIMRKLILPGTTRGKQVSNNWKMWGPKGLLTTHGFFEFGVATAIAPLSFKKVIPTHDEITIAGQKGFVHVFREAAQEIAALNLYEAYYKSGWTPRLARHVRRRLAPAIVKLIVLAWHEATQQMQPSKPMMVY